MRQSVRKSTAQDLVRRKVSEPLAELLAESQFKFVKTRSRLEQEVDKCRITISITIPDVAVRATEDQDNDRLLLWCNIVSAVSSPKFDRWYRKQTGNDVRISTEPSIVTIYADLDEVDLSHDDFFKVSEGEEFRRDVLGRTMGGWPQSSDPGSVSFDDFITENNLRKELHHLEELCQPDNFISAVRVMTFNHLAVSGESAPNLSDLLDQFFR